MKVGQVDALFALGQVVLLDKQEVEEFEGIEAIVSNRIKVMCNYYENMVDTTKETSKEQFENLPFAIPIGGLLQDGGKLFQITAIPKVGDTVLLIFVNQDIAKPMYMTLSIVTESLHAMESNIAKALTDEEITKGVYFFDTLKIEDYLDEEDRAGYNITEFLAKGFFANQTIFSHDVSFLSRHYNLNTSEPKIVEDEPPEYSKINGLDIHSVYRGDFVAVLYNCVKFCIGVSQTVYKFTRLSEIKFFMSNLIYILYGGVFKILCTKSQPPNVVEPIPVKIEVINDTSEYKEIIGGLEISRDGFTEMRGGPVTTLAKDKVSVGFKATTGEDPCNPGQTGVTLASERGTRVIGPSDSFIWYKNRPQDPASEGEIIATKKDLLALQDSISDWVMAVINSRCP